MDLSKIILITDLDGTLLTTDKKILPVDMEAIDELRSAGGKFTIATGRGYSMAAPVAQKVGLDMPAVIFNGAAVYDFKQGKFLWHSEVFSGAREYIKRLVAKFPDIAIEVLREKVVSVIGMNDVEKRHLGFENVTPDIQTVDSVPDGNWLKILIAYPPEKMDKVVEFAEKYCSENVNLVRSEPHFYEILPQGVSKDYGFKKLLEIMQFKDMFTVAAGDYMNDYAMIKNADLGVAVGSALDKVKEAAKLVVCDNDHGAIAETIDYLKQL